MMSLKRSGFTVLGLMLCVSTAIAGENNGDSVLSLFAPVADRMTFPVPLTAVWHRSAEVAEAPARSAHSGDLTGQTASDGTWREEGEFVIINLGGRELRLRRTDSSPPAGSSTVSVTESAGEAVPPSAAKTSAGGSVEGRLMNGRRPLKNCKVRLIPLRWAYFGYAVNPEIEPPIVTTDAEGYYRFEEVPAGPYKLSWLPHGTRQWIRRLEFKPDVIVHKRETSHVKTIRAALRTIN